MEGIENIGAFITAGILLNITPGSDTMFILTRSIADGRKAGVLSAIGINVGSIIHTILISFGLSAIILHSVLLFSLVKYGGALYLIYLGLRTIFIKGKNSSLYPETKFSSSGIFISGVLANLLNPKVALFFLAFLPQFVNAGHGQTPVPFLILGLIFTVTGTIWSLTLALLASKFSNILRTHQRISQWLGKLSGLIFILLGLKIALARRN